MATTNRTLLKRGAATFAGSVACILLVMSVDIADARVRWGSVLYDLSVDLQGFRRAVFMRYGLLVTFLAPWAVVLWLGAMAQPREKDDQP